MSSFFLAYIYLQMMACSDLKIRGICPEIVNVKNSSQKVGIHLNCCANFYVENNICTPCPAGRYGKNCKENCLANYYGSQCKHMCNCSVYVTCDIVSGCICNNSSNCSNREHMLQSKTESSILNGHNDSLPTTMNIWKTEGYFTLNAIHIYMISVSAAMLLICLAAASVRVILSATRKRQNRDSDNYNKKRNGRMKYPVSRDMTLNRSQYASSSGGCRMSTERIRLQCIEV